MHKISSKDAQALLKQAGGAIRTLASENAKLKDKLASNERDMRVVKLAREMEEKGLSSEMSLEEKVAHLRKVKNLDVTEEAVKIASPQGDLLGGVGDVPGGGQHPFETFIQTGETAD